MDGAGVFGGAAGRGAPRPAEDRLYLDPQDPFPSAKRFTAARYVQGDARTLQHHNGAFYAYDGRCYLEADEGAIRAELYHFLSDALTPKMEPFKPNRSKVGDVLDALKGVAILPSSVRAPAWLDEGLELRPPAAEVLPCANGLLHLPERKLLPATPAFWGHNAVDFDFDPAAPEPMQWLLFLRSVWPNDMEAVATLQEIFGYLLTADTSQQKIFLIVGPKRSGKGTISRVLTAMLGQGNVASPTLAGLCTNFGMQPLIGKSLATIGDARLGHRHDQAQIAERLLSISGEDSITVDRKHLTPWTGRLGVRFLIMTNEMPRLSDASGALASRFIVLTMSQSFFGKEDPGLTSRLLEELPGILNWAIVGWQRLHKRGYFLQPASSAAAIEELEALSSPVLAFVRDRCVVGPAERIEVGTLYSAWCRWCEEQGRREPGQKPNFCRDLQAAVQGLRLRKLGGDGNRYTIYEGITVRG
jgi:putative DNA primase/helicase